ncbi:hypothetical protein ASG38_00760 [Flavobacterium sp. Leaf359]|nr:hypothetical protein ASG38_00760 [Flavobacterium sp. Leaf359]
MKRDDYRKLYIKIEAINVTLGFAALRLCVKIIARKNTKAQRRKMKNGHFIKNNRRKRIPCDCY